MTRPVLSRTMLEALKLARRGGGRLMRFPDGFWSWPGVEFRGDVPGEYVVTQTIDALLSRRMARVEEQDKRSGLVLSVRVEAGT